MQNMLHTLEKCYTQAYAHFGNLASMAGSILSTAATLSLYAHGASSIRRVARRVAPRRQAELKGAQHTIHCARLRV